MFDTRSLINADYPDSVPEDERYNYVTEAAAQLAKVAQVTASTLYKQSRGIEGTNVAVNETVVSYWATSSGETCSFFG